MRIAHPGRVALAESSWRFRIAWAFWLLTAAGGTALFAAAPAISWSKLATVCRPASSCASFQLDAATAHALAHLGISPVGFAVYTAALYAAVWLLWYGLAALILWHKPADPGAIVSAFFLVLFPQLLISQLIPGWNVGGIVAFLALYGLALLFPNGRFEPRWTRWIAVAAVLMFASTALPGVGNSGLWILPVLILPTFLVGLQAYRFRRISSWAERQQTKWALLGIVLGILSLIIFLLPGVFAVSDVQNGGFYSAFTVTGFAFAPSTIPIAIAIALLRSRLWDIDRVISRALLYVALTVGLAGTYVGGVLGLQALFRTFTGNGSSAAIAVSTLAIVALFGPLRRRIQKGIDRRFYRGKYDAARTLAAFGERLRDQVDLANLCSDLTSVVQETLHPSNVSLWLRERGGK